MEGHGSRCLIFPQRRASLRWSFWTRLPPTFVSILRRFFVDPLADGRAYPVLDAGGGSVSMHMLSMPLKPQQALQLSAHSLLSTTLPFDGGIQLQYIF